MRSKDNYNQLFVYENQALKVQALNGNYTLYLEKLKGNPGYEESLNKLKLLLPEDYCNEDRFKCEINQSHNEDLLFDAKSEWHLEYDLNKYLLL